MMRPLTPRQLKVLGFLETFIEQNGYAPTLDEVARGLKISKPTAQQYIQALGKKGVITRQRYAHRSIEILPGAQSERRVTGLPILGWIAAGQPLEAVEDREVMDIAELLGLKAGRPSFLLRVKGDSMVEEGILDGDYVVVEKRETAGDGETVVALLADGSATLKRFYREKDRIRLQPASPRMEAIYAKEVAIQGVVRGVFRPVR